MDGSRPPPPTGARAIDDPSELVAFYSDSIAAHLYALADLEEPYWTPSTWYRRGDAVVGLVAIPGVARPTVYAMSTRDPDGTLALLADLVEGLPSGTLVLGAAGLTAAIEARRAMAWAGPHLRYHLTDLAAVPAPAPEVAALTASDTDRLLGLYATEPGAAFFLPIMVGDESYVGVTDDGGRLVAAAGTHVLSERTRSAAIGGVYTLPSSRGRGLGRAVAAGAIHRIAPRVDVIGLNVAEANAPARTIYERLGFEPLLAYEECELA
ncbi:MAG: GNAT family N-acetyltransferase [Actinomycetota bacterium]